MKRTLVEKDGYIILPVSSSFCREVEIIVMPVGEQDYEKSEYFECVGEDGTAYRLRDWTDSEFNMATLLCAFRDDDTTAEEIFDV